MGKTWWSLFIVANKDDNNKAYNPLSHDVVTWVINRSCDHIAITIIIIIIVIIIIIIIALTVIIFIKT